MVGVDYFTKWAEDKPLATIIEQKVRNFVWRCNTPKYTLVVFDMFRVFCKHNLTVSLVKCETWKRETRKVTKLKDKIVNCPKRDLKVIN